MKVSQINNYGNCNFKLMYKFQEKLWNPDFLKRFDSNPEIKKLTDLFSKDSIDLDAHYSKYPTKSVYIFDMNEVSIKGNNLVCIINDLNKFSAEEAYKKYMGL